MEADDQDAAVDDLAGLRATRQRRAVLGALARIDAFASARRIHEVLEAGEEHVGLSTVYRNLQTLADRGVVDVVRAGDGELLFRKCADQAHHHLVCRCCGRAVELPGDVVHRWVSRWARQAGYRRVDPVLEVFGTCPDCDQPECK